MLDILLLIISSSRFNLRFVVLNGEIGSLFTNSFSSEKIIILLP